MLAVHVTKFSQSSNFLLNISVHRGVLNIFSTLLNSRSSFIKEICTIFLIGMSEQLSQNDSMFFPCLGNYLALIPPSSTVYQSNHLYLINCLFSLYDIFIHVDIAHATYDPENEHQQGRFTR